MGSSNQAPVQQVAAPAPDPEIVAQQQQAAVLQQQAVQQGVSSDTANLLRQFGAMSAMAGANLTTPLSSTSGGFAMPIVTGSGAMSSAMAGPK